MQEALVQLRKKYELENEVFWQMKISSLQTRALLRISGGSAWTIDVCGCNEFCPELEINPLGGTMTTPFWVLRLGFWSSTKSQCVHALNR